MILNLLERHRDKWVEDGECYRWIAGRRRDRASVWFNGKRVNISRLLCEEVHGSPLTPKHEAAHDTPNGCIGALCVNGEHLRWATRSENAMDVQPEERKRIAINARAGWTEESFNKNREERYKAQVEGKDRYFTGRPCKNGHIDFRYTDHGSCVSCMREASERHQARKGK